MARSTTSDEFRDHRGGYVVRKPRASDAVGGSLRKVYETEPQIPDDFSMLLRRMDGRAH